MTVIDERGDVEQQVVLHLARAISRGLLRIGEPLPEVEGLARELLVNPRRVAAAFRTLEERGAISGSGASMTVAPGAPDVASAILLDEFGARLRALASEASHSGCARADIASTFEVVARELEAPEDQENP